MSSTQQEPDLDTQMLDVPRFPSWIDVNQVTRYKVYQHKEDQTALLGAAALNDIRRYHDC